MAIMVFQVGPHAYVPIVTRKKLWGINKQALEGQARESDRTLRISHRVAPERREEILRHEYYHAWLFSVPDPRNEEEAAILNSTIGQQFDRDFAAGGGVAALMVMEPDDEPDADPAIEPSALELLRRAKYSTLTGDWWKYFQALCKERKVNIWSDELFPRLIPDVATNSFRLALVVKIELMRNRACRSKRFAGMDNPIRHYKSGVIQSVTMTIYRLIGGERCPFTTTVSFDEFKPYAMGDWPSKQPGEWLEKCCESKLLRRAFAEYIGDMYSQEEMMHVENKPTQRTTKRSDDVPVDEPWQDDVDVFEPTNA